MTAAASLADFIRRFGCTIDVMTGRERDSLGRLAPQGAACAECGDCNRDYGDMGIAAEGVAIVASIDGIGLRWACPGCQRETWEDATLFSASTQAREVLRDPLCVTCRSRQSKERGEVGAGEQSNG